MTTEEALGPKAVALILGDGGDELVRVIGTLDPLLAQWAREMRDFDERFILYGTGSDEPKGILST